MKTFVLTTNEGHSHCSESVPHEPQCYESPRSHSKGQTSFKENNGHKGKTTGNCVESPKDSSIPVDGVLSPPPCGGVQHIKKADIQSGPQQQQQQQPQRSSTMSSITDELIEKNIRDLEAYACLDSPPKRCGCKEQDNMVFFPSFVGRKATMNLNEGNAKYNFYDIVIEKDSNGIGLNIMRSTKHQLLYVASFRKLGTEDVSPAELSGTIHVGDILIGINGKQVQTLQDVHREIQANATDTVLLRIIRNTESQHWGDGSYEKTDSVVSSAPSHEPLYEDVGRDFADLHVHHSDTPCDTHCDTPCDSQCRTQCRSNLSKMDVEQLRRSMNELALQNQQLRTEMKKNSHILQTKYDEIKHLKIQLYEYELEKLTSVASGSNPSSRINRSILSIKNQWNSTKKFKAQLSKALQECKENTIQRETERHERQVKALKRAFDAQLDVVQKSADSKVRHLEKKLKALSVEILHEQIKVHQFEKHNSQTHSFVRNEESSCFPLKSVENTLSVVSNTSVDTSSVDTSSVENHKSNVSGKSKLVTSCIICSLLGVLRDEMFFNSQEYEERCHSDPTAYTSTRRTSSSTRTPTSNGNEDKVSRIRSIVQNYYSKRRELGTLDK